MGAALVGLVLLPAESRAAAPYQISSFVTTASPSVTVGGAVTDSAVLTGGAAPIGGTVRFDLYGPNDVKCAGKPVFSSAALVVPISQAGVSVSGPFTPTAPGTYYWIATYTGDRNNAQTRGKCGDANESVVVTPTGTPTPTTPVTPMTTTVTLKPPPGTTGKCDPATMATALVNAIVAALTHRPGGAFKATCTGAVRIVFRAKEIRPGNLGSPAHDGFTTMGNTLTHPTRSGQISFSFNSQGAALRSYAAGAKVSLLVFAIVHVRPDKATQSSESIQIFSFR